MLGASMNVPAVNKISKGVYMRRLQGDLYINEPMRKHTSWRAGGSAARFYKPSDLADLAAFLYGLPQHEPVYFVGLGSNLLVRDGGMRGTVVAPHARINDLQLVKRESQGGMIFAGAGVACAKVARFAAHHGFAGAEFLAGIPGTIGGALAMNAGCFGTETWQIVSHVQVINRHGEFHKRQPNDYRISYRYVALRSIVNRPSNEEWFTGGWFKLINGNQSISLKKIKELLVKRIHSQPLNLPNAGSVFRNPPGDYAARLIESCGLKGFRIGGAMVSPKHANFIVNIGDAAASDIEAVMTVIQDTVKQQTGIELVNEVRVIGEAGGDQR
ncbi:MAG: UDP-N-acetylenolpyruvoylglucosamine reductase [Nitrosomonas sp.]|nr:MAG: UDP-N-acetylenolpyruvoylglucosamine reductase [Nitrosomonas sp.]